MESKRFGIVILVVIVAGFLGSVLLVPGANADSVDEKNDHGVTDDEKVGNSQGNLDSDDDGLTDDEEKEIGTDPNNSDSDGDGLDDDLEIQTFGTDPTAPDSDIFIITLFIFSLLLGLPILVAIVGLYSELKS